MLSILFDPSYDEKGFLGFLIIKGFLYCPNNTALIAQNQTGKNKVFLQLAFKISMKVINVSI